MIRVDPWTSQCFPLPGQLPSRIPQFEMDGVSGRLVVIINPIQEINIVSCVTKDLTQRSRVQKVKSQQLNFGYTRVSLVYRNDRQRISVSQNEVPKPEFY